MSSNTLFQWHGIRRTGETLQGQMKASHPDVVLTRLRAEGILAKHIQKTAHDQRWSLNGALRSRDICWFIRLLASLFNAGIPIIQTLTLAAKGHAKPNMIHLIHALIHDLESGVSFAEALRHHPRYFNTLFCHLVEAGERSGRLDQMLNHLAETHEKVEALKQKTRKALTYPCIILFIALGVTWCLIYFVVPQFQALFNDFGAELPWATQLIIKLSYAAQQYGIVFFIGLIAIFTALLATRKKMSRWLPCVDQLILTTPIIGPIIKASVMARFSRTLAITFTAGLPLVDALSSVAESTGNTQYRQATYSVRQHVSSGQSMRLAMQTTGLFPDLVVHMIGVGEESGTLDKMLVKLADYYDDMTDQALQMLSQCIEPVLMVFLGLVVGGLILTLYLPLFKLGSII